MSEQNKIEFLRNCEIVSITTKTTISNVALKLFFYNSYSIPKPLGFNSFQVGRTYINHKNILIV